MKDNSHKILVWLYSGNLAQPFISTYDQLELVVPELTRGGLRSVIRHLSGEQVIRAEVVHQQTFIHLTRHGHDRLKQAFPAFFTTDETWQVPWSCLVFLTAPSTDQGFRYLRSILLEERSVQLSRGVYLYPGPFPERVMRLCQELYTRSVVITSIDQWLFGDERGLISDAFSLSDIAELYSGFGNDVNRLLQLKQQQKSMDRTFKNEFSSAFNRFYSTLSQDTGLVRYYFSNTIHPATLVEKFQQLVISK